MPLEMTGSPIELGVLGASTMFMIKELFSFLKWIVARKDKSAAGRIEAELRDCGAHAMADVMGDIASNQRDTASAMKIVATTQDRREREDRSFQIAVHTKLTEIHESVKQ